MAKTLTCARFGPPARFGHFVFTESQMVEEICAKFHQVIVGIRRDYLAVKKLSVFFKKIIGFVMFFNI
jgi:hypothetical protein